MINSAGGVAGPEGAKLCMWKSPGGEGGGEVCDGTGVVSAGRAGRKGEGGGHATGRGRGGGGDSWQRDGGVQGKRVGLLQVGEVGGCAKLGGGRGADRAARVCTQNKEGVRMAPNASGTAKDKQYDTCWPKTNTTMAGLNSMLV